MPPLAELAKLAPAIETLIEELSWVERGAAGGARVTCLGEGTSAAVDNAFNHLPHLDLTSALSAENRCSGATSQAAVLDTSVNRLRIPSATYDGNLLHPYHIEVEADTIPARLFLDAQDSVVHISHAKCSGTGIIVGDEKFIGTANHVVPYPNDLYQVHISGHAPMQARVIARDPSADVALLKLHGQTDALPEPVTLKSYWDMSLNDSAFQISRRNVDQLYMTQGRVGRFWTKPFVNSEVPPEPGAVTRIGRIGYTNESFPGASGSGMFASDGKVFAINTHRGDYSLAEGTAANHLQTLLDSVRQFWPFKGCLTQESKASFSSVMGKNGTFERLDGVQATGARIIKVRELLNQV